MLTPACLFYLGAQHGYRCCAAPSHRDMTASLCSHTIIQPHTLNAPRCCLALLLLILFKHLSFLAHCPALGHCLSLISHTRAHLKALNHTLSSSSPLSLHLTLPLCSTVPACCCSHIPKALPTLSLSFSLLSLCLLLHTFSINFSLSMNIFSCLSSVLSYIYSLHLLHCSTFFFNPIQLVFHGHLIMV